MSMKYVIKATERATKYCTADTVEYTCPSFAQLLTELIQIDKANWDKIEVFEVTEKSISVWEK